MPRPVTRPCTTGDVLRLIREDGVATRADLGRVTGLSRPAVASRVADLIARGLVVERADGPSTGGRPPARLAFNAPGGAVLVANLGQSRGQLAVCDLPRRVLARPHAPPAPRTPRETPPPPPHHPADPPPRTRLPPPPPPPAPAGHRPPPPPPHGPPLPAGPGPPPASARGVGLGAPDAVEHVPGRWDGVEVGPPVQDRFGVPAHLDNEVNTAALGE